MTPALQTRDLVVGYRSRRTSRTVVGNINVSVDAGEMVCLLGVNGVGKSTLLRTLGRMAPALGGTIEINGQNIIGLSQHGLARSVGVVLTERVAIGAMPAYRLVELGRYPHTNWADTLTDADRDIVQNALVAVGAEHLAHRDVGELSDGERQRIMIARALAQRPAVLLLDEPAAFLDVSARVEMIAMLRHLAREQKVAIILSSHDLELSLRTADKIWLVNSSGLLHVGAPEDLLADGSIAAAFSSPSIAFNTRERMFKILSHAHFGIFVTGSGDGIDLARSVIEREGFDVSLSPENAIAVVTVNSAGWTAQSKKDTARGSTFADLARFIRQVSCEPDHPVPPEQDP